MAAEIVNTRSFDRAIDSPTDDAAASLLRTASIVRPEGERRRLPMAATSRRTVTNSSTAMGRSRPKSNGPMVGRGTGQP